MRLQFGTGCALIILIGLVSTLAAENSVKIEGAFQAEIQDLRANIFLNERIEIWMLQLISPSEYKKATGTGFTATVFFSRDFTLNKGKFPIRFNYLNEKNTLGGSVIASGEKRVMFSHDTNGSIEFTRVDDRLQGSFEYTTFDGSKDPRKSVTIKGTFDLERGDALK